MVFNSCKVYLEVYQQLQKATQISYLSLHFTGQTYFRDIKGWITELSRPGFEKLRLGFELLMFYYVKPSSVFLKPSFILRLRFC